MQRMSAKARVRTAGLFLSVRAGVLLFALVVASCTSSQTSVTAPGQARCGVTVTNSLESIPASGGAGSLTVSAARDCTWAASNAAPWIVLTSASNGQGEGSIAYRVAANSAPAARRATIEVNTASADIVQEAAACRFTVTPTAATVAASGESATIQVQAAAGCAWTATTDATWIRIVAGAAGQGDGGVTVAIEANTGGARTARVVVAQTDVVIEQVSGSSPPPPPPPRLRAVATPFSRVGRPSRRAAGRGRSTSRHQRIPARGPRGRTRPGSQSPTAHPERETGVSRSTSARTPAHRGPAPSASRATHSR